MKHSSIASPDGALSFLFAVFGLLMWYVSVFTPLEDATLLSIGLVWLLLSAGSLVASLINMVRGHSSGNTNLLSTILLGFIPGIDTLVALMMRLAHVPYQPVVYGVMYMIGSIFLFAAAWRRRHQPACNFLRTIAVGCGLFFLGLGDVSGVRSVLLIGGWSIFIFALLSFYYGLGRMYEEFGFHLWQGPVLVQSQSIPHPDPDDVHPDRHPFSHHFARPARTVSSVSCNSADSESGKTRSLQVPPATIRSSLLEQEKREETRQERMSSPQMIVAFICATFGMLSFILAWFTPADDSILAAGMIRFVLGVIYFLSALINIFKGSPYGNLNLIFAVCFGLFAGSTLMIQALKDLLQFEIQSTIYGILQLFAGLYLIALQPATREGPLYRSIAMFCSGSGLVCSSINGFVGSLLFIRLSGLFFLCFSLLNIYTGISALLPDLPQGVTMQDLWDRRKTKRV